MVPVAPIRSSSLYQSSAHQTASKTLRNNAKHSEKETDDGKVLDSLVADERQPVSDMMSIDTILMDHAASETSEPPRVDTPVEEYPMLSPHVKLGQILSEALPVATKHDDSADKVRGGNHSLGDDQIFYTMPTTDSHRISADDVAPAQTVTRIHSVSNDKTTADYQHSEANKVSPLKGKAISNTDAPRSSSLGSLLDYQKTKTWLKEMIQYPESYTTQLTPRLKQGAEPGSGESLSQSSAYPTIGQVRLAQKVTGIPRQTTRSDSKFDGFLFRKAVTDFERLVGEAFALSSLEAESKYNALISDDEGEEHLRPDATNLLQGYSPSATELSFESDTDLEGDSDFDNNDDMRGNYTATGQSSSKHACGCQHQTSERQNDQLQDQHVSFRLPQRTLSQNDGNDDDRHTRSKRHKRRLTGQVISIDKPIRQLEADHNQQDQLRVEGHDQNVRRRQDPGISLHKRSHVSLRGQRAFNLGRSRRRQPIARDWSTIRKRFVASVACISTALIGILIGIYAGLVPSIQYFIIDETHVTVLGNTGLFFAMAFPTFFCWPLPLLHGRKPYILSSLVMSMPLLFPQALAVNSQRLTNVVSWRGILLASRALMGGCLGFASMNFHSILMDLFGASLMSVNPHQEIVDEYDARRHGGGMGVWLGIWTWCWIGSLGVGFLVGAAIIDNYHPAWGFYISIIILAVVVFLNVVCPETRRSAYRRSVAEVRSGGDISRRIARGEVMMHRTKTGPTWWGEEVYHGVILSLEMLRQPGFLIMALYSAWIYAEAVLLIVLLGSLVSRYYQLRSTQVGLVVFAVAVGALLAVPFQKANVFSRSRVAQLNTNSATLSKWVSWSSHMVRRTVFTVMLPITGICYAAVSSGPPLSIALPALFASAFGFLSCLAIAECNGFIMEAFDCSDLSPGMTGRQRGSTARHPKKTNYSSFPRVGAGFALIHTFSFLLAAAATALGGRVTLALGQQVATGVVAAILLILSVILLLILVRFVEIKIIPSSKMQEMEKLIDMRRKSTLRRVSMPDDPQAVIDEERAWKPAMIGNPTGKTRRMNIFELGSITRWQEIRKKNKLIDSGAHAHLNRNAWNQGLDALDDQVSDFKRDAQEFLHIAGKKKGQRRLRKEDDGSDVDFSSYSMSDQGPAKTPRQQRPPQDGSMNQIVDEMKVEQREH